MDLTQPHFSHMYIAVLRCSGVKENNCYVSSYWVLRNNKGISLFVLQMFSEPNGSKTNSCDRPVSERSIRTSKFKNCPLLINYQMQSIDSYLHFI